MVEPIIIPPVIIYSSLVSVDKNVVFLDGEVAEDVVEDNINEVKKEINLWVDNNEEVEEVWDKA